MDKNAGRNVNSRGPFDQRLELAGEKENLLSTAAMDRGSSRGSAASEDTEARSIYTSNWTEDKPGHDTEEGEDSRSGDAERRRLREFFDREGWLPGPRPSKKTNVRRKRAM